ncbi:MAG: Fic family protein [Verrucomicrobia bacterium]|nr:Fic family protein [Verrucomicrobiota bacterium]
MTYNWQQPDWPDFRFDPTPIEDGLLAIAEHAGKVSGLLAGLPPGLEADAVLDLMIEEAIKSSAIEGEILPRPDVVSSIRNHLGLNTPPDSVKSGLADGAGALTTTVRRTFAEPLTEDVVFAWHSMLMKSIHGIKVGDWRTGRNPMQVVSGLMHRPTIHFEAPPSSEVPREMARFIAWFNRTSPDGPQPLKHAAIRSGIAHVYFESIHPFEDGNGRIGRAISEKALAQGLRQPGLFSLSRSIEAKRSAYYDALESAQRSNDLTGWLVYFVDTVLHALVDAKDRILFVVRKARFLDLHRATLSERQNKVILRMFEAGPEGFIGGMNARKYIALTGVSKATATRDLQDLAGTGVLVPTGGGRSASYQLNV